MTPRLLALIVATVASGCGSSDDSTSPAGGTDQEQIEAVISSYNAAAENLDAEILCAEVIAPSARGGSVEDCANRVGPAMEATPESWSTLSNIDEIKVSGESASATVVQDGAPLHPRFVREDGRWWMQVFD